MDMDLPPNDDPRRHAVRSWLAEHPRPTQADLAASGYLTPHWPERGASMPTRCIS